MCFLERVETKTKKQNSHSGKFLWVSFLGTELKHVDNNRGKENSRIRALVLISKFFNHESFEIYGLSPFIIQPVLFKCSLTSQRYAQADLMDILATHSRHGEWRVTTVFCSDSSISLRERVSWRNFALQ